MLTVPLEPPPPIADALRSAAGRRRPILFDSAKRGPTGRWSFLAADPVAVVERQTVGPGQTDWLDDLRRWRRAFPTPPSGAPPFAGGVAGVLSYDAGHAFERLARPPVDEFAAPAVCCGAYDWVIAWDHAEGTCRLVSTGVTAEGGVSRAVARRRADGVLAVLGDRGSASVDDGRPVEPAIAHAVPAFPGVTSNFTPGGYDEAVEAVRRHIAAGDIFQANLAQRLVTAATRPPVEEYLRLREVNAAPMAGYFDAGDWQLLSASPERFLELSPAGRVETRPIKGTLKRPARPEADLYARDALRQSEKDRAENVMIVDLMRNDLARVCRPGSVAVPRLCEIETYETVQHLVSVVAGRLREGTDAFDLLAAAFPGGSITGCPKIRAMDVITALEGVARGPYCGSLFYASAGGRMDSSILIRSALRRGGRLAFGVGGGVTYASDAEAEYRETLVKAEAMVEAFGAGR